MSLLCQHALLSVCFLVLMSVTTQAATNLTMLPANGDVELPPDPFADNNNGNDNLPLDGGNFAYQISVDGQYVVYIADGSVDNRYELYSVKLTGPDAPVSLFTGLGNRDVVEFQISFDSTRVIFLVREQNNAGLELYTVAINGGPAVRIDSAAGLTDPSDDNQLPPEIVFELSIDSTRVVYSKTLLATNAFAGRDTRLYSVGIMGTNQVELSEQAANSIDFLISEDSNSVVYNAVPNFAVTSNLFSVPIAGGNTTVLDQGSRLITQFEISADSVWVVFGGVMATNPNSSRLHSVPLNGGTVNTLSGNAIQGFFSSLANFLIDRDSQQVIFAVTTVSSTGTSDSILHAVPIAGGNIITLADPDNAIIFDLRLTPNNQFIVYTTSETQSPLEGGSITIRSGLFSVPLGGGNVATLGNLQENKIYTLLFINDNRVPYLLLPVSNSAFEGSEFLASVPASGGSTTILAGPLPQGRGVLFAFLTFDGEQILYIADQDTNDVFELYKVAADGSSEAIKLNDALPGGGDVSAAFPSLDNSLAIYRADQASNDVNDLWLVDLTGNGNGNGNGNGGDNTLLKDNFDVSDIFQ